ncbi:hypothetical protein B296_00011489 [Ensete ventricosum]|uniref:Uncharacterized protein n=1 Tax=Ensete ventricosum TaxID=4639 RepID=A0A427AFH1_ENSVE|nr:hypothetical protein B296_00011489 [Ensete ventricosum]
MPVLMHINTTARSTDIADVNLSESAITRKCGCRHSNRVSLTDAPEEDQREDDEDGGEEQRYRAGVPPPLPEPLLQHPHVGHPIRLTPRQNVPWGPHTKTHAHRQRPVPSSVRKSLGDCLLTYDDEVDGERPGGGESDADVERRRSRAAEGLLHGGRVRERRSAARSRVPQQELRRGVRQERGCDDEEERRDDAEHPHRRRERHDPRPDDGRRQVEHRAGDRRFTASVAIRRRDGPKLRQQRRDRVATLRQSRQLHPACDL